MNDGILLNSGKLVVVGCQIAGFVNSGIEDVSSGNALVENTTIGVCNYGILSTGAGQTSLRSVNLQGNSYGLDVEGGPVDISHSLITQNTFLGLYAYHTTLSVSNCIISGNATGVYAATGSIVRLTGNDLFNNTTGIGIFADGNNPPGIVSTALNNHKAGSTTPGAPTPGKVIVTQ